MKLMNDRHSTAMADVSGKTVSQRKALAGGKIILGKEAFDLVDSQKLPKGDALSLAEYAGIQGAKMTSGLIPLCHPISLSRVSVFTELNEADFSVDVFCLAEIEERTGVEMEALCGLSIALLTIWDLCKPVNPALKITETVLLYKSGGKSGLWSHPDGLSDVARSILEDN
ncbi:MAG: cyclic pyranopterin phosphate synthase [Lysobacterales bacterium]|jgi:cyclic pyranopterin phosphate synthase